MRGVVPCEPCRCRSRRCHAHLCFRVEACIQEPMLQTSSAPAMRATCHRCEVLRGIRGTVATVGLEGSSLLVELNTNGDATAEMSILPNNATGTPAASDFLL